MACQGHYKWTFPCGLVLTILGSLASASAQQASSPLLDQATLTLWHAAVNPQNLFVIIKKPADLTAEERNGRTYVAACFQTIHDYYAAQLPGLYKQLEIVKSNIPHGNVQGTAAYQAVVNAEGYARATNIADIAITNPDGLSSNSDFQFNKNLHDQLEILIESWKKMPNSPAAAEIQAINAQYEQLRNTYRNEIKVRCQW